MQMKFIAISLCVLSTVIAAESNALSYYVHVSAQETFGEFVEIGGWDGASSRTLGPPSAALIWSA